MGPPICFLSQDMYFRYIWNNFLHIQVEICTAMILAMPPAPTDIQSDNEQEHSRESILITHVRLSHPSWPICSARRLNWLSSLHQLFQKCQFIQRIVEAWSSNEREQ